MPKIAVDAMGGDRAAQAGIEGLVLAARGRGDEIILVGDPQAIESELAKYKDAPKFSIVAAPQIVPMHVSPSAALRIKDSSIKAVFELMKRGEADAVISAGNSGAMMAIGMLVMGRLPQVGRPAILVVVPSTEKGTRSE